LTLLVWSYDR